jgi:hypothetical protein
MAGSGEGGQIDMFDQLRNALSALQFAEKLSATDPISDRCLIL